MAIEGVFSQEEFAFEARRLDALIWDATAISEEESVLFCGFANSESMIERALAYQAYVWVIESNERQIQTNRERKARVLRGSTSVIPARDNTFDVAVAHHYLHEVDPFFHAQIVSELARVARRVVIVEPAPPSDALGQRIALLYSRAKREFGAFENYQPLDYWRKLLSIVKADVSQAIFGFAKVPPKEYLFDTIELLLHTIRVQEAPPNYIDELRRLADRPDAQLLPPARYVLVGAAVGELPERVRTPEPGTLAAAAGLAATAAGAPTIPVPPPPAMAAPPSVAAPAPVAPPPPAAVPWTPPQIGTAPPGFGPPPAAASAPVPRPVPTPAPATTPTPAPAPIPAPAAAAASQPPPVPPPAQPAAPVPPAAPPPFGIPTAVAAASTGGPTPFGIPFAMPAAGRPQPGATWKWEPPEEGAAEPDPPPPG